jgi:hypothetical protein
MGEKRTWSVPVYTFATTALDFTTDIDPIADPEGFEEAFMGANPDFPSTNSTNRFDLGEWELTKSDDGTPEVTES